ncbi:hypothetical protein PPTG_23394 [Phytophthora nicotianae INRA-310]|uniref:Uncharacterized protein n=1 Tax=Phytophthora nicotianae (strain INRA-310) TaxID=761204 RepID=W2PYL8_PHYN3|nr:hypothetical protein PPTG_23394 [Phytophthora nicotianae INRA-310]ETN05987.1 hypothetical protein PPTG_23394 [Phytophthora nicotianae INRA-310]
MDLTLSSANQRRIVQLDGMISSCAELRTGGRWLTLWQWHDGLMLSCYSSAFASRSCGFARSLGSFERSPKGVHADGIVVVMHTNVGAAEGFTTSFEGHPSRGDLSVT